MSRHLLHVIPSFRIGGVPVRLTRLINHFGDRYRHTVVALDGLLDARERVRPDLNVGFEGLIGPTGAPLSSLLWCRRELRKRRPDLLITYNWGAIDWAMANQLFSVCAHIHQEDGFGVEEARAQFKRRIIYRRLALATTREIIVPSRTLEEIALQVWRFPTKKVVYLPNGIDIARFADARPPAEWANGHSGRVIGTVAPLRPEKNLGRLLHAFAGLAGEPTVRLVIAGDGGERVALEQLAETLGLAERVSFLGNVSEPQTILKTFDIFAISSDTEQMPTTVLEAMACGLPIAAVDVGDIANMLAPENRPYVVPKDDGAALSGALKALLDRADMRCSLGQLNQARARQYFSEDAMFAAYDRIFSA